ncbi:MAG: UvrD-helicase domain-containing protein [Gammaproteobacteria bacterium]
MELNPAQREAVRHVDGPLLVLAGAGSGKTRVITRKIVHLVRGAGYDPGRIAAVTFTNKAAREMRTRLSTMLDRQAAGKVTVSTFHTLGLNIIRAEHALVNRRPGFSIYDERDACALLAEALRSGKSPAADPEPIRWRISQLKGSGVEPAGVATALPDDPAAGLVAAAWQRYEQALEAYNAVDFDDLIVLPVRLLRADPQALARWQARVRYLLVDEYQDTNRVQYELVRLLVGTYGALTVVGDDDQSIYGWRGAHPENLAQLARDFPALKVVKLEQNYRSAGNILKAANALIAHNPHVFAKRLWSDRGLGDPIAVLQCADDEGESIDVASRILAHKLRSGGRWADYAILYRGNHQARPFERALRERNVPYALSGGPSFFDYSEVKDLMSYLRLAANPGDDNALLRVINTPRREIGAATVSTLAGVAAGIGAGMFDAIFSDEIAAALSARALDRLRTFGRWFASYIERAGGDEPVATVRALVDECNYRQWLRDQAPDPVSADRRVANVEELLDWIERLARQAEAPRTLAELTANLMLRDLLDRDDDDAGDRVRLLTLHSAKGLEFPHVFLVGMEEGTLPHRSTVESDLVAEERRLAYVGITRAQTTLTITMARRRRRYGALQDCVPSRFLDEIPQDLLNWSGRETDPVRAAAAGRETLAGLRSQLRGLK